MNGIKRARSSMFLATQKQKIPYAIQKIERHRSSLSIAPPTTSVAPGIFEAPPISALIPVKRDIINIKYNVHFNVSFMVFSLSSVCLKKTLTQRLFISKARPSHTPPQYGMIHSSTEPQIKQAHYANSIYTHHFAPRPLFAKFLLAVWAVDLCLIVCHYLFGVRGYPNSVFPRRFPIIRSRSIRC